MTTTNGKPLAKLLHIGQSSPGDPGRIRIEPPPVGEDDQESQGDETNETQSDDFAPTDFLDLTTQHPETEPHVIHGVVRAGEVMLVTAGTKEGKSFLVGNLTWACISGSQWLGHDVEQGAVLLIDNELKKPDIVHRLWTIADNLQVRPRDYPGKLHVHSLRGRKIDIEALATYTARVEPGQYRIIIIDALYKLLPKGCDENSNSDMTNFYNDLICLAERTKAAVVVVHHMSKGDQASKKVTDLGAGAGAATRSIDTLVTIREHETDGLSVMEYKCRSMATPKPQTVKYEYPLWSAVAAEPVLRQKSRDAASTMQDQETDRILEQEILGPTPLSVANIRSKTGWGESRINRGCGRLVKAGIARWEHSKLNGKGRDADRWSLIPPSERQQLDGGDF